MGINSQSSVPKYSAGEVLTAANLNISAGTGVPVFDTTTQRDAAFGGAGEKVLAEGQLCYLESTDVVQFYNGSTWATVGPQTLTSGLNYVTGAAFTSVSTVSLPNSTFTSTYRNYRVILHITSTANAGMGFIRMRAGGADDASNVYRYAKIGLSSTGVSLNSNSNLNTSWEMMSTNVDPQPSMLVMDLIAPQVATQTLANGIFSFSDATYNLIMQTFTGRMGANTQFDALSFLFAGNNTGVYRVYGYSDS